MSHSYYSAKVNPRLKEHMLEHISYLWKIETEVPFKVEPYAPKSVQRKT